MGTPGPAPQPHRGPPAPLWVPWGCHPPPWVCPGTPAPSALLPRGRATQGPLCPRWDAKQPQNEDFSPQAAAPKVLGLGGRRRAGAAASFASASIKGFAQRPAGLLQHPKIWGGGRGRAGGAARVGIPGQGAPRIKPGLGPGGGDAKICRHVAGPWGGDVTPKRPPQPQTHRGGWGAPVVLPPPFGLIEKATFINW